MPDMTSKMLTNTSRRREHLRTHDAPERKGMTTAEMRRERRTIDQLLEDNRAEIIGPAPDETPPPGLTAKQMFDHTERIIDIDIRDRVVRGIECLNQAVKDGKLDADWPARIDPNKLVMSSSRACVLGQLFDGDYNSGYELGIAVLDIRGSSYGFDTVTEDYSELDDAWQIALGAR